MDINSIQATAALTAQLNLDVQSSNVQAQVTQLPINQILLGAVAGNDKNGNVIIKLAGNDLLLSSPIALAKNAQVSLKIENVSGSIVATLLSVDGKLPATQPQKVLLQGQPNPQDQGQGQNQLQNNGQNNSAALKIISVLPAGGAKVAEPINFPPNATNIVADTVQLSSPSNAPLSAIVIAPALEVIQAVRAKFSLKEGSVTNSELEDSLPDEVKVGTSLKVKITPGDLSAPTSGQKAVETDNRSLGKPAWLATSEETKTPGAKPDDLQAKVQNFTPQIKTNDKGNLALTGIVLHSETNGEVLLQTALGKVLVNAGQKYATVEKGTLLNLEVSQITAPVDDTVIGDDDDSSINNLTKQWPALQTLAQHDDGNATPILNKLAGLDQTFAGRLATFADAVKTGDIKSWLGNNYYDALAATDDGKVVLSKLKNDFASLRDTFAVANQNGWQSMLFPIFDGQQLNQARLHVKYLPDENNEPSPKVGTRFLVELNTSGFGEIQLDGLVRANVAKHFDLMVRTHDPLDMMIKQDIHNIFNDASEVTGFKGNLEFSVTREFPNNNIIGQTLEQKLSAKIDHTGIEA